MKIVELNNKTEIGILVEAASILKRGGVLVLPTDTVYGLAADATNVEAVQKVFSMKVRNKNNPVPVFVNSFEMLGNVVYLKNEKIKNFLETVWPGKITCVLPSRGWMPLSLRGGGLTIGVRMPQFNFINLIIKTFGNSITGTSANISGKGSYYNIEDVIKDFKNMPFQPDLVISAGDLPGSPPSTVIEFNLSQDEIKILREGAVLKEEIIKIWKEIV